MNHMTAIVAQRDFNLATDEVIAVSVSQGEHNGLLETLYLQSIPGMRESILKGKATPIYECLDSVGWETI